MTPGEDDPASGVAAHIPGARLPHAAPRPDEGGKVAKLREAVGQVRPASRVLAFADSDGRPGPQWLRELVRPLAQPEAEVGATTGYRWHMPRPDPGTRTWLPSLLRAVWNSFITSLLGHPRSNFCWGGSMALRRETFERLRMEERWRGSVSDDYTLSTALRGASLKIRFVPACLVPNYGDCGWRELLSWTTRQIIITRVYAPGLWKLGLAAHGLYCLATAALAASLPALPSTLLLAGIAATGAATGAARTAQPERRREIRSFGWAFVLLAPLIPFLMLYNFVLAGLTRTITWRGTSYRLDGPRRTVVLWRESARPSPAPATNPE